MIKVLENTILIMKAEPIKPPNHKNMRDQIIKGNLTTLRIGRIEAIISAFIIC